MVTISDRKLPNGVAEATLPLLLIGIAAALRFSGLNSELWFDELASLRSVTPLRTLGQVLWSDHTDNKHHLTWAWLWLTGPARPRVAVPLAIVPRRRRHAAAAVVRRPPLVRPGHCRPGRAAGDVLLPAGLLQLRGPRLRRRSRRRAGRARLRPRPEPARPTAVRRAVAFNLCLIAGFLSHLTFAYTYAGLLAWAAVDTLQHPRWLATAAAYHAPTAMVMAIIWWFDVSRMTFAGGPPTAAVTVLRYLAALTVGMPTDGPLHWLAIAAAVALCVFGITVVGRRQGAGRLAFVSVALFVVPVVLTVTRRTPYLAMR